MFKKFYLAAATSALLTISTAATYAVAQINVTYSGPGVLTSSIADAIVFDFDNQSLLSWSSSEQNRWLNTVAGSTNIGSFSSVSFHGADEYGGAGGINNYITEATLTLNTEASYFGLWWSAGNGGNVLEFYLSDTLVAQFTSDILNSLSDSYNGNPSGPYSGSNTNEKYAFLNFYGSNGFTFDKIQSKGGGFENDNWTIRNPAYGSALYSSTENSSILPGTYVASLATGLDSFFDSSITSAPELALTEYIQPIPEASSISYTVIASLVLAGAVYRRRKSKAVKAV
jgi:hypothetical protein